MIFFRTLPNLLVVTGASRGLGRAFAVAMAKSYPSTRHQHPLYVCLIARSENELLRTKEIISEAVLDYDQKISSIEHYPMDLADLNSLERSMDGMLQNELDKARANGFDQGFQSAYLVNNAGSIGDLLPVSEFTSLQKFQQFIDLNVTSGCWITNSFLNFVRASVNDSAVVVNVSSLWAVQPCKTVSQYCTAKAARDMFHKTLALEVEDKALNGVNVKVLNYAPGPCDTSMQSDIRESDTVDKGVKEFCINSKAESTLVEPMDSAEKLAMLVFENKYCNGDHIDFFDC